MASPTPAEIFERDDLEFSTITTLLHLLGSRDRITLESFRVPRELSPRLKLLTSLASLLVRDHETLAIILKHSSRCSTVYIGCGVELTGFNIRDDDDLASSTSSLSNGNFNARNVELLISPEVSVGPDVYTFMLNHWFVDHPILFPHFWH